MRFALVLTSFLFLAMIFGLSGCLDEADEIPKAKGGRMPEDTKATEAQKGKRFKVESQGWFKAGTNDTPREIVIVTDIKTGKEYLGITGVGISELVKQGKSTVEE